MKTASEGRRKAVTVKWVGPDPIHFSVPLLRALARTKTNIARLDFPGYVRFCGDTHAALLALLRCAGAREGGAASLRTVDLRKVSRGIDAEMKAELRAAGAAAGVTVLLGSGYDQITREYHDADEDADEYDEEYDEHM